MRKLLLISSVAIALLSSAAFASNGLVPQCDGPSCTICDLIKLVHNVINYAIQLSFVLAIAMVVFGGYNILTSAGSEEKVTQGRKIIWYAALGLVLVLAGWAIVNTFFMIFTKSSTWNKIPDDCGLPGISTDIKGPSVQILEQQLNELKAKSRQLETKRRAIVEDARKTFSNSINALPEAQKAEMWMFFNNTGTKDAPLKEYFDALDPATAAVQRERFRQYVSGMTGFAADAAKADQFSAAFTTEELQYILYGDSSPFTQPSPNTTPFPSPDSSDFGA